MRRLLHRCSGVGGGGARLHFQNGEGEIPLPHLRFQNISFLFLSSVTLGLSNGRRKGKERKNAGVAGSGWVVPVVIIVVSMKLCWYNSVCKKRGEGIGKRNQASRARPGHVGVPF